MDQFSISQLAQFSGIKAHTIRMWEQRYHALKPYRTEGNTRYYDNNQLRRLLNIVSLLNEGYKVSELCRLSDEELIVRLKQLVHDKLPRNPEEYYVSQLVAAGMNYDEGHFEKIFSHCLLRMGLKESYDRVLYPLIHRMGLLWTQNDFLPGYEHFISNMLRQKFWTAIDSLPPSEEQNDGWLLFLPENEYHELGLLYAHYVIRSTGRRSIYLGANLPLDSVSTSIPQAKPANLLLFLVHNEVPEWAQSYVDQLTLRFPHTNIYISGKPELLGKLVIEKPIYWLTDPADLEQVLINSV
ncbi:MAG TPA: MerR family transcriptional regulator [Cyclobacteriaceae bacterium]|nr:MerR family transcriptional regulator [Cyclobacteriaceae bacterium]